jgi:hypothetical protein
MDGMGSSTVWTLEFQRDGGRIERAGDDVRRGLRLRWSRRDYRLLRLRERDAATTLLETRKNRRVRLANRSNAQPRIDQVLRARPNPQEILAKALHVIR